MNSRSLTINHLSLTIARRLEKLLANTGDMALKRRARRIIEETSPQSGDKILEVGCGDGFYLHLLSNLGIKNLKLFGIDIDEKALKSAKRNLKGKSIRLEVADVMKKLTFDNGFFDKIIMSEVCEHLEDDVKGLKEARRVLKKGGTLVVTVPNYNFPFLWDPINWILQNIFGTHVKSGFWAGIWNQHKRLYKRSQIENVIKKAGYKISKSETLTRWCLPFNHYIINLGARIIVHDGGKIGVIRGGSKFKPGNRKGFVTLVYYYLATLVDELNYIWTLKNTGVGLLVVVKKLDDN